MIDSSWVIEDRETCNPEMVQFVNLTRYRVWTILEVNRRCCPDGSCGDFV